jgi:hypothetical protein
LTSPFGVTAQIWLALFPGSLQMVSEPPSNARSCGIRALHDVALTRTSGIQEGEFVTPRSYIGKMRESPHRVGDL